MAKKLAFFLICISLPFVCAKKHRRHVDETWESGQFPWQNDYPIKIHPKIFAVIEKCCPKSGDARFCCASGLFGRFGGDVSLMKCQKDGDMTEDERYRAIKCGQREFNADESTNICKIHCCGQFENFEGTRETDCSKACKNASINVGMTATHQIQMLNERRCLEINPPRFGEFLKCLERDDLAAGCEK